MKTVKETIHEMMTENTGSHMLDSGGAYGRNHERNGGKSIEDFDAMPDVTFDVWQDEITHTVSVWHYLTGNSDNSAHLDIDDICTEFNRINTESDNWDSDAAYGVSSEAGDYLETIGATILDAWNTYNGENTLSQVLQGAYVEIDGARYVLLQIHGGCDVRGGYTDARLFSLEDDDCGYVDPTPMVFGDIDGVQVDSCYCGYKLTLENGEDVTVSEKSKVELSAA